MNPARITAAALTTLVALLVAAPIASAIPRENESIGGNAVKAAPKWSYYSTQHQATDASQAIKVVMTVLEKSTPAPESDAAPSIDIKLIACDSHQAVSNTVRGLHDPNDAGASTGWLHFTDSSTFCYRVAARGYDQASYWRANLRVPKV